MDNTEWHTSVQQMIGDLTSRMEHFEGELQRSTSQPHTITTLAAEYSSFKAFTLKALRSLQDQIEMTARSVDQLEMHSRRKILLIHGVPEVENEDTASVVTKVVAGKLKVSQFSAADISRCHRMGRASSNRPRPVLVKLKDVAVRDKAWFAKTNLKNSGITLSEFLTKARHSVFMKARQHFGVSKCWTRDGNVFVISPDGKKHRVNWLSDFTALAGVIGLPQAKPVTAGNSSMIPAAPRVHAPAAARVHAPAASSPPAKPSTRSNKK